MSNIKKEQLLSIFDQSRKTTDGQILNIREEGYPTKYRPLIRRLQKAASESEIRKKMDIEDEVLEELQDLERLIAKKDKRLKENERKSQKRYFVKTVGILQIL